MRPYPRHCSSRLFRSVQNPAASLQSQARLRKRRSGPVCPPEVRWLPSPHHCSFNLILCLFALFKIVWTFLACKKTLFISGKTSLYHPVSAKVSSSDLSRALAWYSKELFYPCFVFFLSFHKPNKLSQSRGRYRLAQRFPSSQGRWLRPYLWLTRQLLFRPRQSSSSPCRPLCCPLWSQRLSASNQHPLLVSEPHCIIFTHRPHLPMMTNKTWATSRGV